MTNLFLFQANHTYQDVGKFYTIPDEDKQNYFQLAGIPRSYAHLTQIFNETTLMVRKPALEVIEYLKNANYDKLPVKYVIRILFIINFLVWWEFMVITC